MRDMVEPEKWSHEVVLAMKLQIERQSEVINKFTRSFKWYIGIAYVLGGLTVYVFMR
jgi:hypothetical protein